jgi:PAS domain-containing protein
MSNLSPDPLRPFRRAPVRTPIEVSAAKNGAGVDLGLRDEKQAFELPLQLFEQLPFAVYVCDRDGLVRRYNRRAAELWGRSPNITVAFLL